MSFYRYDLGSVVLREHNLEPLQAQHSGSPHLNRFVFRKRACCIKRSSYTRWQEKSWEQSRTNENSKGFKQQARCHAQVRAHEEFADPLFEAMAGGWLSGSFQASSFHA